MRPLSILRALLAPIVFLSVSACASAPVAKPHGLEQTTQCMLQVLKGASGVTHPALGYKDAEGWRQPYLEYHSVQYPDWMEPTRFYMSKADSPENGPFEFETVVNGFLNVKDTTTNIVIDRWYAQCGVIALVLSV